MPARQPVRWTRRRGSTLVMTMIFMALFVTLAVSFTAATNLNMRQAYGYYGMQNAQMAAESGVEYGLTVLNDLVIPIEEAEEDLPLSVAKYLAADLNFTPNMDAKAVSYDGIARIATPAVDCGTGGHSFKVEIFADEHDELSLLVTGYWHGSERRIAMDLDADTTWAPVFNFGVASKGKIVIGGDGAILGANDSSEADILSATYSDDEAVLITASCTLDGSISTSAPDSYVTIKGKPTIGGTSDPAEIEDSMNLGVGAPVFPEIDTTAFEAAATTLYDPAIHNVNGAVLENVRIPAGVDPHFSGDVTIRGVLFIEEPNEVIFNGNTEIIGTIATEDPGDWTFDDNTLTFLGSVTSSGVETLPDEPQFADLKEMPGSMLLAPGFGVTFSGNYSTINGAIAADKFSMTGNAGGTIYGPIICYGDTEFEVTGSAQITIDRSKYDAIPAGFSMPVRVVPVADTYSEPGPGEDG